MNRKLLTAAALLVSSAAFAQTETHFAQVTKVDSFFGVPLNQPPSLPSCDATTTVRCVRMDGKDLVVNEKPLGGPFVLTLDSNGNVGTVYVYFSPGTEKTVHEAMVTKFGDPYFESGAGALWHIGGVTLYYAPSGDHPCVTAMTTQAQQEREAKKSSEVNSVADKF
ncbi:MAG TPA: hypothetical protein VIY29_00640 [Ktedonobacteraceae bacterium]